MCSKQFSICHALVSSAERLFNSPQVSNSPLFSKRSTTHQLRHILSFFFCLLLWCVYVHLVRRWNLIKSRYLCFSMPKNKIPDQRAKWKTSRRCLFIFLHFHPPTTSRSKEILLIICLKRFTLPARTPTTRPRFISPVTTPFEIFHFPDRAKMAMALIKARKSFNPSLESREQSGRRIKLKAGKNL